MIFESIQFFGNMLPFLLIPVVYYIILFWEIIFGGWALWKSGRNNQPWWFFFILIFHQFGILPILYLLLFQKKGKKR